MSDVDKKIMFMKGTGNDGLPVLVMTIPRTAFDDMHKNGTCSDFDFTKIGIPFKMMIQTAEDHADAMKIIEGIGKRLGIPLLDERRKDFGVDGIERNKS